MIASFPIGNVAIGGTRNIETTSLDKGAHQVDGKNMPPLLIFKTETDKGGYLVVGKEALVTLRFNTAFTKGSFVVAGKNMTPGVTYNIEGLKGVYESNGKDIRIIYYWASPQTLNLESHMKLTLNLKSNF